MLERHEMDGFLALAEELHFGRAADRLLVSRAHISQTIKKLERRIGAPLFIRTSRQVTLTPLGQQLAEDLAPHHRAIEEAVRRAIATAHGTTGTLRVGFVGALWGQLFVDAADLFRGGHPGCEVRLSDVPFGEAQEPVRSGALHLMNASFPVREDDIACSPTLVREPRLLAISSRHQLAALPAVTFEQLARVTMLSTPTMPDYWARERTLREGPGQLPPPPPGPQVASLQEGLALIAAGKGAFPVGAQVTRFYARPDIAYVPITDAPPLEWGLVWKQGADSPLLRDFREAVEQVIARCGDHFAHTIGPPGTAPGSMA